MDGPLTIPVIQKHLDSDRLWRMRRHPQWTLNYELYRDTVIVNRLTQRQSVNVPYMKGTLKTYLSQTNTPPDNEFEDKGNDGQKSLYMNEYWADCMYRHKIEVYDEIDRKQEWLYGRSFTKLNIIDGQFYMEIIDPQDVLLDRYMNPWDIETARRVTHIGIYRTLTDLKLNPMYDQDVVKELEDYFGTQAGLITAGQNTLNVADRSKRMLDMGVPDVIMPILGETYVELNELQVKVWDEKEQKDIVWVVVTGQGNKILMQKRMLDILGVNFYTWATWASEVERTDVWSDGGADSVRSMNLVANARWSQKVENGTLMNYGMQFYDSTKSDTWRPVGYEPSPFGFYPIPGNPKEMLQRVDIEEMRDVFNEMDWIEKRIQTVTAASSIEQGQGDASGDPTLGEIQILAAKAAAVAKNSSKYHKQYWEDIGLKFAALIDANAETMNPVTLYKKNSKGSYYKKSLRMSEVKSKEGYSCKVTSKADKESDSLQTIQKMQIGVAQFPGNPVLKKIYQKKVLDWMNLSPDETKEVMDSQQQVDSMMAQGGAPGQPTNGAPSTPQGMPLMPSLNQRQPVNVG